MLEAVEAEKIYFALREMHGDAHCELDFITPFELLVAVILSAQCTDKRVNAVTRVLFEQYNTPEQFADMSQSELEGYIYTCGFYRNKAKNIIATSRDIVQKYGGEVPSDFDSLLALSGVGRKTANVVMANAFGADAIAVDTHCYRVSHRLGISAASTPEKTEYDLTAFFAKNHWSEVHHLLIFHGRYTCTARNPRCTDCSLTYICKWYADNRRED